MWRISILYHISIEYIYNKTNKYVQTVRTFHVFANLPVHSLILSLSFTFYTNHIIYRLCSFCWLLVVVVIFTSVNVWTTFIEFQYTLLFYTIYIRLIRFQCVCSSFFSSSFYSVTVLPHMHASYRIQNGVTYLLLVW